MWSQFFLEHIHFAVYVGAALVFFAVAWLYFDAWTASKRPREIIRSLGFLLFSLSFLLKGMVVESQAIGATVIPAGFHTWAFAVTRLTGYLLIITSLLMDPINPKPETSGIPDPPKRRLIKRLKASAIIAPQAVFTLGAAPLLGILTGLLYLYRATAGMERHLRGVAVAMLLLSVTEFLALRAVFATTNDIGLYAFLRPYSTVWIIEHIILIISVLLLGKWVFGYLLKRFETQIFILFTTAIVVIFLLTSLSLTTLLVKQIEDSTYQQLITDAALFRMVLTSQEQDLLSYATLIGQSPDILTRISTNKRREIAELLRLQMINKKINNLLIVGSEGEVIANGEDIERFGEIMDDHPLISESLKGTKKTSMRIIHTNLVPGLTIEAASPIRDNDKIIGAVLVQQTIDTALLDGVKNQTNLDVSLYAGKTLSATTLLSPDGVNRPIGTIETRDYITTPVLTNAQPYTGVVSLLNKPYVSSYSPVTNTRNEAIGMIMVGKPMMIVIASARRSIEITFILTTILMALSIIPSYLFSRFLVKQIR